MLRHKCFDDEDEGVFLGVAESDGLCGWVGEMRDGDGMEWLGVWVCVDLEDFGKMGWGEVFEEAVLVVNCFVGIRGTGLWVLEALEDDGIGREWRMLMSAYRTRVAR